nr:hypothetical protein [uncultured Bacteroides sp.]
MKELSVSEMYEVTGGFCGFNWNIFLKATLGGAAIGGSVYIANKTMA